MAGMNPVENILSRLESVKPSGHGWIALCPAHSDTRPSLSISQGADGSALINCFAGCRPIDVLRSLQLSLTDLFPSNPSPPLNKAGHNSLSLSDFEKEKGIPKEFLEEMGIVPVMNTYGRDVLRITYFNEDGRLAARQRIRTHAQAKHGSTWTKGPGPIIPYDLWRLSEARERGFLVLVEGETDCLTLWHEGYPALGIPGADMANQSYFDLGIRLLMMARTAYSLYKVRSPMEKRELLNLVASNLLVDGENICPSYRKPFDLLVNSSNRPNWRPQRDSNP